MCKVSTTIYTLLFLIIILIIVLLICPDENTNIWDNKCQRYDLIVATSLFGVTLLLFIYNKCKKRYTVYEPLIDVNV